MSDALPSRRSARDIRSRTRKPPGPRPLFFNPIGLVPTQVKLGLGRLVAHAHQYQCYLTVVARISPNKVLPLLVAQPTYNHW